MEYLKAVLLGIVQGLTEFLPVSSTGHLVVLEHIMAFRAPALLFHVFVHTGTMIAVILVMRRDVVRLLLETGRLISEIAGNLKEFLLSVFKGTDPEYKKLVRTNYRRLVIELLAASIPTAGIGFLFMCFGGGLMTNVMIAGIGFLLTGITLLVSSMLKPRSEMPKDVPVSKFLLIGIAQGFSVIPGISRFALTWSGGILSGFSKKTALRISILMLLPVSAGALIAELIHAVQGGGFTVPVLFQCLAGTVAAAVCGVFVMRAFLRLVQTRSFKGFAYYSFAAGIVSVLTGFLL